MSKILWLTPALGQTTKMQLALNTVLTRCGINVNSIFYQTIYKDVKNPLVKKGKKLLLDYEIIPQFKHSFDTFLKFFTPDVVVINDRATLAFVSGGNTSLFLCRGSVYKYVMDGKIYPCICIDELKNMFAQKHGKWLFMQDFQKINRWSTGQQRNEPKFTYHTARTRADLIEFEELLQQSFILSIDIETKGIAISCLSYTGIVDCKIVTRVIPFLNPTKPRNCHWENEEDEIYAWNIVKRLNGNNAIKTMQGGAYDCAYFIRYQAPVKNYFIDSMYLFHSLWCELPKKLNFISSICLDYCRYWKDEIKGSGEDSWGRGTRDLERYWRYNALDTYHTLLDTYILMLVLLHNNWAFANFQKEMATVIGPALAQSMRGLRVDKIKRMNIKDELEFKSTNALIDIRIMTDTPEFNPNSSDHVSQLMYKVLGAPTKWAEKHAQRVTKKTTSLSVDEKILRLIRDEHPIYAIFIDKIWDVKKPLNNIAKYANVKLMNDRLLYNMNAAGTVTWRFSSSEHQFWCGTNAQNIPYDMRDMLIADPGYLLFDRDYSQSDAYFVAHEAEDDRYIENVLDDRDLHCVHGEHFFKIDYATFLREYKNKNPKFSGKVLGLRQISKKITHAAGYYMGGYTLYVQMRRPATVQAAKALGYDKAHLWDESTLIQFCDSLLESFYQLYPGVRKRIKEKIYESIGNTTLLTNAFGYTRRFFGDISRPNSAAAEKVIRDAASFYGQGGTAGNINNTLKLWYWQYPEEIDRLMMLLQVHDSLIGQVRFDSLHCLKDHLTFMEQPITIENRTFVVPTETQIGLRWGNSMLEYEDGMTVQEIVKQTGKDYPFLKSLVV